MKRSEDEAKTKLIFRHTGHQFLFCCHGNNFWITPCTRPHCFSPFIWITTEFATALVPSKKVSLQPPPFFPYHTMFIPYPPWSSELVYWLQTKARSQENSFKTVYKQTSNGFSIIIFHYTLPSTSQCPVVSYAARNLQILSLHWSLWHTGSNERILFTMAVLSWVILDVTSSDSILGHLPGQSQKQ